MLWALGSRLLRRRIVYQLDDALYEVAPCRYYAARCRMAAYVLTGTDTIAAFVTQHRGKVCRVDGWVEVQRYRARAHRAVSPVTLGYAGSTAGEDIALIAPVLNALAREREIRIVIVSRAGHPIVPLESAVWRPWSQGLHHELFGAWDIALAPLADTAYNRGREAFKIKEYMAAGLPVVCSPVGHNVKLVGHGATGFVASGDAEWYEALVGLIDDHELRARMGRRAQVDVAQRFSRDRQLDHFIATLQGEVCRGK